MALQSLPRRILLKISGEMLKGDDNVGLCGETLSRLAKSIAELIQNKIEVGIVLGGGNLFRGIQGSDLGISRVSSDFMGMLATLINGIALQEALRCENIDAKVMSAIPCTELAPPISLRDAKNHIKSGKPVIFVGGTGNPFFTTDTAAALRAAEIKADLVVKATKVSGVYSSDPIKNKEAKRFEKITYAHILEKNLSVMDSTAIALCMSVKIPIFVFKLWEKPTILAALQDPSCGTIVSVE